MAGSNQAHLTGAQIHGGSRMKNWYGRIVGHLAQSKRDGIDFPLAWLLATTAYPPLGGVGDPATLFDESGERHETAQDFFRRVCRDAYEDTVGPAGSGNGPSVRFFRGDMVRDVDDSSPARRSTLSRGRVRQAA